MSLLIALIIGAAFGVIVGLWFGRQSDYLLFDLLIGISGAILGEIAGYFIQSSPGAWISLSGVLFAAIGAGLALLLFQAILRLPKKQHKTVIGGDVEHHRTESSKKVSE